MRRERANALASVALGVGMAANAILGPLMLGIIRVRESPNMETQLLGGELTSLFLAAPLACIAGILWWRAPRLAPVVGIGPAGYALYTYVQFVLVPDYSRYSGNNERFFPLYLALVMLGGWLVWRAWHELWATRIATPSRRLATINGILLVVLNGAFALAWLASIGTTLFGQPTAEYREHPTGFWLIRLMDLGFIIPFGLTTGVGLLRRAPWASRNAYAFAGTQALLASAVSGMAIRMWVRNDPAVTPALLIISTVGAVAFVTMYVAFIGAVANAHVRRPVKLLAQRSCTSEVRYAPSYAQDSPRRNRPGRHDVDPTTPIGARAREGRRG